MGARRVIVTGAAGFIGSHLVEALLDRGHIVTGVDSLTNYYPVRSKLANLAAVIDRTDFELVNLDLASAPLEPLLEEVETVFHLAGQPGVRSSWASGFSRYVECNILATQRLLEACRGFPGIRVVNASSSSVYGDAPRFPTTEDDPTRPVSPYGVTKLAAEHLCSLYGANWGVSTISLRYFSVYGPRQRPDMATYRMIDAALGNTPFPVFGDGRRVRDFTYVMDVVAANLSAADSVAAEGAVYNIGGGSSCAMSEMLALVSETVGRRIQVEWQRPEEGDAMRTGADITRAAQDLGWYPVTSIEEGIKAQVAWHRA